MSKQKRLSGRKTTAIAMSACLILSMGVSVVSASAAVVQETKNKFFADYTSYCETEKAAEALNLKLAEEGFVLLKNKDNALPLSARETGVSVFGRGSYNYVIEKATHDMSRIVPFCDALEHSGFKVNPFVKNVYTATGTDVSIQTLSGAVDSYDYYGDAALITISRNGGEGDDLSRDIGGGKHYLELTDDEEALITYVTAQENIKKVIIVLNSAYALELGELEQNDKIDAILWIGQPGYNGIEAVGEILNGTVNPSGRLVDEYFADFSLDPTWYNFGDNSQVNFRGLDEKADTFVRDTNGNYVYDSQKNGSIADSAAYRTVNYAEGIYVGYRYVETVYEDFVESKGIETAEAWYNAWKNSADKQTGTGVVYPFGYGLSYTDFEWSDLSYISNGDQISISVKVKNVGDYAGKDVVQLYVKAPYYGGIEKSAQTLVTYEKTELLQPNEEQILTMTFSKEDLASFDDYDKNNNGNCGFELDEGDYVFSLRKDSHTKILEHTVHFDHKNLSSDNNIFSKNDANNSTGYWNGTSFESVLKQMSRREGLPASRDELMEYAPEKSNFSDGLCALIDEYYVYTPDDDETSTINDWVIGSNNEIPAGWTQATEEEAATRANGKTEIQLGDLVGVKFTNYYSVETYPSEDELTDNDKLWETFMNQLTWKELVDFAGKSAANLDAIGLPKIYRNDSVGILQTKDVYPDVGSGQCWVAACIIASTWNDDIAYEQGRLVGNESLFMGVSGWWGPGANTHRSPFGGRNYQYYSQDGVQAARIAAAVSRGAQSKGCVTFFKHFALNDQETFRNYNRGILTWASEQAMRELYFKPFEAVMRQDKGASLGIMCSFNRIGAISINSSYALLNTLGRGEWGFMGSYITDAYLDVRVPADLCVRTGTDNPLGGYSMGAMGGMVDNVIHGSWDDTKRGGKGSVVFNDKDTPTSYFAVRRAAQMHLYTSVNSNTMKNNNNISAACETEIFAVAGMSCQYKLLGNTGAGYSEVKLVNGTLPKGLTLSVDGTLSGTPENIGTYEFTIQVNCDAWVRNNLTFTLTVNSDQTFNGNLTAQVGKAYGANVKLNEIAKSYTKSDISVVSGLPKGVNAEYIAEEGVLNIYGTPEEAGVYNLLVCARGITITQVNTPFGAKDVENYVYAYDTYTLTVNEADALEKPKYTVTFNTNGGSEVATQTVTEGEKIALPVAPQKEQNIFIGWYYDEACTMIADVKNSVHENVTLYAGWTAVEISEPSSSWMDMLGIAIGSVALVTAGAVAIYAIRKKKN